LMGPNFQEHSNGGKGWEKVPKSPPESAPVGWKGAPMVSQKRRLGRKSEKGQGPFLEVLRGKSSRASSVAG